MSHMYPAGAPVGFEDQSHIGQSTGEPEHCQHQPDGMQLNSDNEVVSSCEHCGRPLKAVNVDDGAMQKRGELYITEWREE